MTSKAAWATAVVMLVLLGCSGSSESATGRFAGDRIDLAQVAESGGLTAPQEFEADAVRSVLAPGTRSLRWAEVTAEQVCVFEPATDSEGQRGITSVCANFDGRADESSVAWSPDGSTMYFNEDWARFLEEPDIWSFDSATNTLTNLTDDGEDERLGGDVRLGEDAGLGDSGRLDTTPFAADDGTLYHFSITPDEASSLWSFDATTNASEHVLELPGLQVFGPVHPIGNNQFLATAFHNGAQTRALLHVDLVTSTFRQVTLADNPVPGIVASGFGAAVLTDLQVESRGGASYQLLDFDGETGTYEISQIELAVDPLASPFPAFALSPDGNAMVISTRPGPDDESQLHGYQRDENGQMGDPFLLASPGFLGTTSDGERRFIFGSRTLTKIVWTSDNELLLLSNDQALVYDLSVS